MVARRLAASFSFDDVPVAPIAPKKTAKLPSFPMRLVSDFKVLRKFVSLGTAALAQVEETMKEAATTKLISLGCQMGKRPKNFTGTEGPDEVTMIFSKRSSVLSPEEVDLLGEHGIPLETSTTPESFAFNSDYLDDPIWRKKIATALRGLPSDIIRKTPASTKTTVGDATIDAIFAQGDARIAAMLLPLATSFALREKKSETSDVFGLLSRAGQIMALPRLRAAMTNPANDRK